MVFFYFCNCQFLIFKIKTGNCKYPVIFTFGSCQVSIVNTKIENRTLKIENARQVAACSFVSFQHSICKLNKAAVWICNFQIEHTKHLTLTWICSLYFSQLQLQILNTLRVAAFSIFNVRTDYPTLKVENLFGVTTRNFPICNFQIGH